MNTLRGGFTTGSCAAAAAKAAVMLLSGSDPNGSVTVTLPDGTNAQFSLQNTFLDKDTATAVVVKDAGDDPDVTNKAHITVSASWNDAGIIELQAGEGIGTVTLPGLQINVGEPAINPVPRHMIQASVRTVTARGVTLVISVPNGKELAKKTFNEKLGITGGISIIGTTGRVKPFSCEAIREALKCSLNITKAANITHPVLVPGNIGQKTADSLFKLKANQSVQVGNDWGYMLDAAAHIGFDGMLLLGHPGKLVKLAMNHWDTHSSRSQSAAGFIVDAAANLFNKDVAEPNTSEGLFTELTKKESFRLANHLSAQIRSAAADRINWNIKRLAVVLVNMKKHMLGSNGDLSPWTGDQQ